MNKGEDRTTKELGLLIPLLVRLYFVVNSIIYPHDGP